MSYHLLQDYDMALKILEEFRKTQQVIEYKKSLGSILSKKGKIIFYTFIGVTYEQDCLNATTIFQGVNRDVVGQVMQALYNKVHFRTYWDVVFLCNHYKCTLETCALVVFFQLL